jgi:hypothetical protein
MKTKFYFPMILSLLVMVMSLFTACSDSDNPLSDTTKPVIDLNSPTEGQVLAIGSEHGVHFEMELSDDVMLKSYKIEIHNNFDHHSHDTRVTGLPWISLLTGHMMCRNKERRIFIIMIS